MKDVPLDKSLDLMSSEIHVHVSAEPQLRVCMYTDQSPTLKASAQPEHFAKLLPI